VPHEHFIKGREGGPSGATLKRIWLFVLAITLHNFPEGLAVGSGIGSLDLNLAGPILAGIALQDIPEGFVVAMALVAVGYSRWQGLFVAIITGLVEALAALIGFAATVQAQGILPWALAFSGGAMLYVISDEIIPESHRKEFAREATAGLMFGFALMMFLDTSLG
jgi:ZIP family zinc transporter